MLATRNSTISQFHNLTIVNPYSLGLSIRLITKVNCFPECNRGLAEAEEVADLLHVLGHNDSAVVEVALLLLRLLCQDVAVVCVVTLYLACSGERESLLRAGVSLYFWHFFNLLIINY